MLSLFGCVPASKRFTATITDAFDTVTTVVAYDSSVDAFNAKFEKLEAELKRLDRLFDIYSEYEGITNLCTVNKTAAEAPVRVEKEIINLLIEGKKTYTESKGKINVCLGSVLELWHTAREAALENPENAYLPDMKELKEASRHTDIDALIINEKNETVSFKDEKLKLDVGAIAKGYSAELLKDYIKSNSLWKDFMLNLGGNVVTNGYKNSDGKTKWAIQIENPDLTSENALETLQLTNLSVVTSGDYQRYFEYEGKSYCHIIDPKTLMPAEYFTSVTVICENSALADRLSTELFVTPLSEGKALVEKLDKVEAVWVDKSYNETRSSGFEQYLMR